MIEIRVDQVWESVTDHPTWFRVEEIRSQDDIHLEHVDMPGLFVGMSADLLNDSRHYRLITEPEPYHPLMAWLTIFYACALGTAVLYALQWVWS
jgi:hypothetical protein